MTVRPDFLPQTSVETARHTTLLVSAFKGQSHSIGRAKEVEGVRVQAARTDEKVKRWCEETLEAIIIRQTSGNPHCADLAKCQKCESEPDYESFNA